MNRQIIATSEAPAAIGPYSQAVRVGDTVWLSGQIPLDPATGQLVEGGFEVQVERAFENLAAVVKAAGGRLEQVAKLTLFLTDLGQFGTEVLEDVLGLGGVVIGDVEQAQRGRRLVVGQCHLRAQLREHQAGGHAPLRVGGVAGGEELHADFLGPATGAAGDIV